MSWKIGKEFEFSYGHRVWSQELIEGYSEDMCMACRHLHGHQGKIIVYLESIEGPSKLERGMVTDFKHLGWFKKWVDNVLDHKFIMDINDPLINHEIPNPDILSSLIKYDEGYSIINNPHSWDSNHAVGEKYEGMVFVNFVPTSENLSKWLCDVVNEKMNKIGIRCIQIQFYETPKSQSNYFYEEQIEDNEYISLFDFLGRSAGAELGKEVVKLAKENNILIKNIKVKNKSYDGNILTYPKTFLLKLKNDGIFRDKILLEEQNTPFDPEIGKDDYPF